MKEGVFQETFDRAHHHIILELNPQHGVYAVGTPTEDHQDAQRQFANFQLGAQGTNISYVLVDFAPDQGYPMRVTRSDGTKENKMVIHGAGKHIGGDGLRHRKTQP